MIASLRPRIDVLCQTFMCFCINNDQKGLILDMIGGGDPNKIPSLLSMHSQQQMGNNMGSQMSLAPQGGAQMGGGFVGRGLCFVFYLFLLTFYF